MTNLRLSKKAKIATAVVLILLVGGGLAFRPLMQARHDKAYQLVAQSQTSRDPRQKLLDLQMAHALQPGKSDIIRLLAAQYRLTDQAGEALKTINLIKKPDRLDLAEKSRILLELDRVAEATEATTSAGDKELQAICAALSGKTQAQFASSVGIARYLYGRGMMRSSLRFLMKEATLGVEENLILAKAQIALKSLPEAKKALLGATRDDPANLEAHKLLKSVYEQLGDKAGADKEAELIGRLESGKI